ncbi:MAG: HAD hydrolase-like protein [Candidatus Eremiobacterota bacterium]
MRLILFDIDGTLIRSDGVGMRALGRALIEVTGLDLTALGVRPDGQTDPGILREAFERGGHSPTRWEVDECEVLLRYPDHLRAEIQRGRVWTMPGVEALLDELAGGAALGLLTGNLESTARVKLEHVGLSHHFPVGGFGSDSPDRNRLGVLALERARRHFRREFPPQEVWVVGDTGQDVAAARAAGARVLAVATGSYGVAELQAFEPDAVLPDLADLRRVRDLLLRQ